tara:strand:+ start:332 stop:505 length:174 start_codon:yes stop_codon:yes gene_type:complete
MGLSSEREHFGVHCSSTNSWLDFINHPKTAIAIITLWEVLLETQCENFEDESNIITM